MLSVKQTGDRDVTNLLFLKFKVKVKLKVNQSFGRFDISHDHSSRSQEGSLDLQMMISSRCKFDYLAFPADCLLSGY